MHDRNGTPLQPGELVRYRFDTVDVTGEVMRAGPDETIVVAVPFPSSSGMGPMTTSEYDQLIATARDAGAPVGYLPTAATPDHIEKLGG